MKFEEAVNLLREGKKVRRRCWIPGMVRLNFEWVQLDLIKKEVRNNLGEIEAFSTEEVLADDWEEYKELLNDFEKNMLGDIFHYYQQFEKTTIKEVKKISSSSYSGTEFVRISFINDIEDYLIRDFFDTPHFEKGTMFKNLELGKNYTLKELKLE